jgi:hypothetical protein
MKQRMLFQASRSLGMGFLIIALASLTTTRDARAQGVVTITCETGTETSQYSPGITNTPANVTFIENETDACVDTADLTLTGGSETSTAVEDGMTCTGNVVVGAYDVTFKWDNGEQSVVDITSTVITKLGNGTTQAERTGTVLSGPGEGGTFTQTITTTNLDVSACSTQQGLISNSGVVVTSIVAL